MKRLSLLLTALLLVLSLGVTAIAAGSSVNYEGHNLFGFAQGSDFSDTDLFSEFKSVMPGDVLTETVTVKNTASCCDFIKVYLRAEAHSDANPLSPAVAEQEDLASMEDFLSQLHMTVREDGAVIYEASPDQPGGLAENVLLGTFRRNEGTELTVQLEIPLTLENEYAGRLGEVDWVFTVEEYDDANPDVPETGDESHIVLYATVMVLSAAALAALLLTSKKRRSA